MTAFLRIMAAAVCLLLGARNAHPEAMLQLFNLTWNEVSDKIPEIAEAGYTSLWLPPPTKGGSGYSAGYDLWDPFDLGDKDQRGSIATRYGTRDELLRMVQLAHRFGLRVYFDNIVNHRAFDVPRYNATTPTNLYPGMAPADFHLRVTPDGFFRNTSEIRDYNSTWQVQNLSLSGLVDIAHESPNANFGPSEGGTAPKPVFVRHPDNPEYYDYHPTRGRVGFGALTQADLDANPNFYQEDVNAYLIRSVRWLMDQTRCDGLRLDAVKHVPSYFFGAQSGAEKDTNSAGYVGSAQLQFNLTHGFSDANHRNANFDTETTRNDALIFGEHLGEPPGFGEYVDAGMRLLDNPLRNYLNNVLGNPTATLVGLEQRDGGGFSASVRVMHAQSHDNDYAARRELQNGYYFFREGIPLIYSDGYNKSPTDGGVPFPRHANAPYLGQFGDTKMPDLAWLHHQLARGGARPRWGDSDVAAFERYDYRESANDADQTVVLFAMNDNYGFPGDISFDDGVAQDDAGMPSTCYPVQNSRNQGLVVGFPPGSRLRQLADSPGKDRACPELLVRLATNIRNDAVASQNDPNPVNRKIYVGSQSLASGGGAIEFKIPSGSYVAYAYQWPEPSRVDTTLTNSAGVVAATDAIVISQAGRVVPRAMLYRTDGKDGDPAFNPLYPFKMRGSVDSSGHVVRGLNLANRTYGTSVPVVTNAAPLDFLVRVDGSAVNVLLKLDGGMNLNSHLGLGAANAYTHGILDLRDNKPGSATDMFLGYEQTAFRFRFGPEKFAARNVVRDTLLSLGAETYAYTVGSDETTNVVNGSGFGHDYPEETCAWVYHNPAANNNVAGQASVRQRSSTTAALPIDLWVKAGYQAQSFRCSIYFTTDGSNPEGAYGVGHDTTRVTTAAHTGDDAESGDMDWWKGTIPAQAAGITVKYKIALFKPNAGTIIDFADAKHYALTEFAITNWDPSAAQVWVHNNLATNQVQPGLPEGFHILRARAFLPRTAKSSVFNTFLQTFYYDAQPPDALIAYPTPDATLASVDYDLVVRADATASEVEFNLSDSDPNNDDAVTGFNNGNGLTKGVPVFAQAHRVTPLQDLSRQYPDLPQEFRFTFFAVPPGGSATITVRIKEFTTAAFPDHYRLLTRTVNCAAPPQTMSISFPSTNGQEISLNPSNVYTVVTCFSSTLTPDINLFRILVDGAEQSRTNLDGSARYRLEGNYCGAGKRDLRFDWNGMSPGQHYLQVIYNGDGLNLQASRLVRVTLYGVTDTDGDGLPDSWELDHALLPDDSTGPNGASGDADQDGFSNLAEYLAGTNPQDPNSLLRITNINPTGEVISWSAIPGKNYQIYAATNATAEFLPLGGSITAYSTSLSYTNTGNSAATRFYRIKVIP